MAKEKDKKKKLSSEGTTTREKLLARKKKLAEKGTGNGFVFPKNGTTRIRIVSAGANEEFGMEIIRFYLGDHSVYSPATFNEACPFMEKYDELKSSKDEDDKRLAKKLVPSRRFVIPALIYKDDKGKELDYDSKARLVMVPSSVYQDIIELYLDEDEAGDMTDPKKGYDIKIERSGSGQYDTSYSVRNCKPTKVDKDLVKPVDLESMVRGQIKNYEELEEELEKFLNSKSDDDEDEDDAPKKKKKDKGSDKDKKKDKKKKKRHGDI